MLIKYHTVSYLFLTRHGTMWQYTLCQVVCCHVMQCQATSCHATTYHTISYITFNHTTLHATYQMLPCLWCVLYHTIQYHILSDYPIIPHHTILSYIIPYIISHLITLSSTNHILSRHISSYQARQFTATPHLFISYQSTAHLTIYCNIINHIIPHCTNT